MEYAKSSSIQPVGLEEPRVNSQLSTSKGGSPANVAPVGAQPPVIGGNPEVVPIHQVHKEDVMEAPKQIQHFENLDAQHDHPGLQAPVYHDNDGDAFDDDDIEDNGLAPHEEDYDNNKVQNIFCRIIPKSKSQHLRALKLPKYILSRFLSSLS